MDPLSTLQIAYPQGAVFYGGQSVHGELIIDMKEYIPFSKITVECIGKIVTHREYIFSFLLPLYNTTFVMQEIEDISRQYVHGLRKQRLAFRFQLPIHCNQALECGRLGHVRYWCQATITVSSTQYRGELHPLAGQQFTCWRPITVLERLDLNDFEFSRITTQLTIIHPLKCTWWQWCSNGGEVTAHLQLNKTAFVPGENIYASFDVNNRSQVDEYSIHLMLTQSMVNYSDVSQQPHCRTVSGWERMMCSFSTTSRSLYFTAASESYMHIQIPFGETFSRTKLKLHIPSLPTSSMGPKHLRRLGPCTQKAVKYIKDDTTQQSNEIHSVAKEYLHVSYRVLLVISFGYSLNDDLLLSIPIWLGTVPLQQQTQQQQPISSNGVALATSESLPSLSSSTAPSYVDSVAGCVWLDLESCSLTGSTVNLLSNKPPSKARRRSSTNQVIEPTQFAPQYVYYPTIDLVNDTNERLQRGGSLRKSILKRKNASSEPKSLDSDLSGGNAALSNATSQHSIQWSNVSETSLSARFETPI